MRYNTYLGRMANAYDGIIHYLVEQMEKAKPEENIDCHHQDSNQGRSLEASDALTT